MPPRRCLRRPTPQLTYGNTPERAVPLETPPPRRRLQPPPTPEPGPDPGKREAAFGDGWGRCSWCREMESRFFFFSFLFFLSFIFFFFGCCFCCLKWSETRQEAAWEKVEQKWKNTNSPAANGLSVQTKVFSGLSPSAPTPARARTPANTLTWSHTRARAHIYTHTDTHAHTHALPGEGRAARVQHETATQ